MKSIIKLNCVSAMYGLLFFMEIQLIGNVSRLSRILGWDLNKVEILVLIINIVLFLLFTYLCVFFTNKYMKWSILRYFSTILWFPYFAISTYVFTTFWPIKDPAEVVTPVYGLLLIGSMIIYPIYIILINGFGVENESKT